LWSVESDAYLCDGHALDGLDVTRMLEANRSVPRRSVLPRGDGGLRHPRRPRMFPACDPAICTRKCVARDRACTRATCKPPRTTRCALSGRRRRCARRSSGDALGRQRFATGDAVKAQSGRRTWARAGHAGGEPPRERWPACPRSRRHVGARNLLSRALDLLPKDGAGRAALERKLEDALFETGQRTSLDPRSRCCRPRRLGRRTGRLPQLFDQHLRLGVPDAHR
jgi:hypothetical protein